ncbi:MAG TPA: hypothetical protein PKG52_11485 [bacterium]|nr:hypothetical protein [bacterium]
MHENIFDFINDMSSFEKQDSFEQSDFLETESLFSENNESALGGFLGSPSWNSHSVFYNPNNPDHNALADADGDGIPNLADNYDGPGRNGLFDEPLKMPFFGNSLGSSFSEDISDKYEEIDFKDVFSEFLPDSILSSDDGSTATNRVFENLTDFIDPNEHYHTQEAPNSCAVAVQTDILNDFGINVSETEMRDMGEQMGIYTDNGGTPLSDVGKLIEEHGIELESQRDGFTLDDLMNASNSGEKIIIGLDAAEIWNSPDIVDSPLETYTGGLIEIPTAGHAVEFKGIFEDFDGNLYAIVDDPGHPNGHNVHVPIDDFLDAWSDFDNFAVITKTK